MPLRDIDRKLVDRCLRKEPGAWNDFVDRYMGLIYHVIQHVAYARSRLLSSEDVEDIAAEILLKIVDNDYAVLKKFKGISSLPTYLTVIARRTCVKELIKRHREEELGHTNAHRAFTDDGVSGEVEAIVFGGGSRADARRPDRREAEVVRLYHLKFLNYRQIGKQLGFPKTRSVRSWRRPARNSARPPSTSKAPVESNCRRWLGELRVEPSGLLQHPGSHSVEFVIHRRAFAPDLIKVSAPTTAIPRTACSRYRAPTGNGGGHKVFERARGGIIRPQSIRSRSCAATIVVVVGRPGRFARASTAPRRRWRRWSVSSRVDRDRGRGLVRPGSRAHCLQSARRRAGGPRRINWLTFTSSCCSDNIQCELVSFPLEFDLSGK